MELQKLLDKELEVLAKNIQDNITRRRKTLATVTNYLKRRLKKRNLSRIKEQSILWYRKIR